MAKKLQKLTEFENPAPSAYDPKDSLTKPQPQRPINFDSDRTDFSKSITGKNVGPGVYQVEKQDPILLGKIGKGPKFDPEKNKNVCCLLFSLDQGLMILGEESADCRNIAQGRRS